MTPKQCTMVDWYQKGIEDGANGKASTDISSYVTPCSKVNITPNVEAWNQGRTEGLKSYCTAHNAYLVGLSGKTFQPVCKVTGPQSVTMIEKYELGRKIHKAQVEINSSENEIRYLLDQYQKSKDRRERDVIQYKINNARSKISYNRNLLLNLGYSPY